HAASVRPEPGSNSPNWYLERAIAHFETSDENLHSLILDLTFVISHSLVVQFSKINVSFFVVVACQQRPL
ncbi:hypothetical protein, partial [Paenibacillus auburnensis]|uniref:hypothetical protein n=1 Tax=Paenibacillus auburnensis TaxID=2905649 RepID=UPI001F47CCF0